MPAIPNLSASASASSGVGGDLAVTPNFYSPVAGGGGAKFSPTFNIGNSAPILPSSQEVREAPRTFGGLEGGSSGMGGNLLLWLGLGGLALVGLILWRR
jgi:hypothetical protein